MTYALNAQELYDMINCLPAEQRGTYITAAAANILYGVALPSWISELPKPKSAKMIKLQGGYSEPFEFFWAEYPRKENKAAAYKAWQQQVKAVATMRITEQQLQTSCLAALLWQRQLPDWTKNDGQYIPHAATYLNNQRWQDMPPQTVTKPRVLTMDGTWR